MSRHGALAGLPHVGPVDALAALPARRRRWPVLVLLLAAALLLLAARPAHTSTPTSLQEARLVGVRGPGCIRLVLLADVSGSMAQYTAARTTALGEVLAWVPGNLRPDDELAVIDWAAQPAAAMPVTTVAAITGGPARLDQPTVDPGSTNLTPAVELVGAQPASRCRTLAAVLSDGLISDPDPAAMLNTLKQAHVDQVQLLRPSPDLPTPTTWRHTLPYAPSTAFNGNSPTDTALTFGQLLATLTGQHLTRT